MITYSYQRYALTEGALFEPATLHLKNLISYMLIRNIQGQNRVLLKRGTENGRERNTERNGTENGMKRKTK